MLQFKSTLFQLHQVGYCHADVSGRNLCVRRDVDAAGQTRLECRLIDFSETFELSKRDEQLRGKYIANDFAQLEQTFAELQRHASSVAS